MHSVQLPFSLNKHHTAQLGACKGTLDPIGDEAVDACHVANSEVHMLSKRLTSPVKEILGGATVQDFYLKSHEKVDIIGTKSRSV